MRTRRQRLGQHFLRDRRVAQAIVDSLPAEPPRILEVGPGRGALTGVLLGRFASVRAVEVDPGLAGALHRALGNRPGLEVVCGDMLEADLESVGAGGPWQVAAHLPYSVGTPIVRRLLARPEVFPSLVVMVQLEVAERLVAPPGERSRGLLTLEVEGAAEAELLFTVSPRCFAPPPKVMSAVVRLRQRELGERPAELAAALALAARAFTLRRKKITNALAFAAAAEPLRNALGAAGVDPSSRPEDVRLEEWLALARALGGDTSLQ